MGPFFKYILKTNRWAGLIVGILFLAIVFFGYRSMQSFGKSSQANKTPFELCAEENESQIINANPRECVDSKGKSYFEER